MASSDAPGSGSPAEVREEPVSSTSEVPQDQDKQTALTSEVIEAGSSQIQPSTVDDKHNQAAETAIEKPAAGGDSAVNAPSAPPSEAETAQLNNVSNTESPESKAAGPAVDFSSEQPSSPAKEVEESGPSLVITLLLTTGARHPFKIDGKYLRKRAVNVDNHDPFGMSVYTLKELILREWRPEWEPRPSSPSSIRLIYFGKLLEDKAPLSDSRFSRDAPNVVHMTIKPQEIVDEEDAKGAKANYSRERDASERSPRCHCVIL